MVTGSPPKADVGAGHYVCLERMEASIDYRFAGTRLHGDRIAKRVETKIGQLEREVSILKEWLRRYE